MDVQQFMKKKRRLWHRHFGPSLIAAVAVALLAFFFESSTSLVVMLASVGASAVILTNRFSHHLCRLHTTILAYLLAFLFAFVVSIVWPLIDATLMVKIFIVIFGVTILVFLFDVFHPPAVGAGVSFALFERSLLELAFIFVAIVILFIAVRFVVYLVYQHLSMKEFKKEFEREF